MTGGEMDLRIRDMLVEYPTVLGFHWPDSRQVTTRGMPDWIFISVRGVIWRECKGSNDTLTREQRRLGRALTLSGQDWRVWGPRDLMPGGVAETDLRRIA